MRKIMTVAATAAATCAATPALAQEESPTTFYVGALAGYDSVELSVPGFGSDSQGDVMYGVTAGVDTRVGERGLIGFEAEFTDSEVSASADDVVVTGDRVRISAGRDLYVGVRGGLWATQRFALYAKAGYTNARVNGSYDDGTGAVKDHTNRGGIRFGGGVEFKATEGISVRGEYRHSEYKAFNTGAGFSIDASRDQFAVGLVGKF